MVEGQDIPSPFELSILISRNVYGIIPLVLSFSTNVLATSLVAYKAWCVRFTSLFTYFNAHHKLAGNNRVHRKLLKQHFSEAKATSRALKALALLTESGCIYCAILVLILFPHTRPSPGLHVTSLTTSTDSFPHLRGRSDHHSSGGKLYLRGSQQQLRVWLSRASHCKLSFEFLAWPSSFSYEAWLLGHLPHHHYCYSSTQTVAD